MQLRRSAAKRFKMHQWIQSCKSQLYADRGTKVPISKRTVFHSPITIWEGTLVLQARPTCESKHIIKTAYIVRMNTVCILGGSPNLSGVLESWPSVHAPILSAAVSKNANPPAKKAAKGHNWGHAVSLCIQQACKIKSSGNSFGTLRPRQKRQLPSQQQNELRGQLAGGKCERPLCRSSSRGLPSTSWFGAPNSVQHATESIQVGSSHRARICTQIPTSKLQLAESTQDKSEEAKQQWQYMQFYVWQSARTAQQQECTTEHQWFDF